MNEDGDKPKLPWYLARPQYLIAFMAVGGYGVHHEAGVTREELQNARESRTREIQQLRDDNHRDVDDLRGRVARLEGQSDRK